MLGSAAASAGTGPAGPAAVRLRGWGWRHGGRPRWVLRGVDLDVGPGERVLLLGPSGAGKSTLLAALTGLLDPTAGGEQEGEISVDGRPALLARDRVGMVFQDPDTQLVLARAGDDVAFGAENRGLPREEIWRRVDEALAMVGFPYGRDRPTEALSGGERQRLALAGVLALRPGLLLLDEPTANLDPDGAALVRAALGRASAATGATLLLVDHRVDESLALVDRVVVLSPGGGVLHDGPPAEVFARHDELVALGVWVPGGAPTSRVSSSAPGAELMRVTAGSYRHPGSTDPALSTVDMSVRQAEAVAVTGANGSGKSTLALLVAGLLRPSSGEVRASSTLAGADAATPPWRWPARRLVRRVGTVFQNPEHQFLTGRVADELAVGPLRAGHGDAAARTRAGELLDRLHLAHLADANPYTLSGGEKRRLSVATALATAPGLLVLDEPTFGQDLRTWTELVGLIGALRDDGRGVLVVTHDRAVVDALADRELVATDGRVAAAVPA